MKDLRVLEISHVLVPGVAQDLARYLRDNFLDFSFIEHPFKISWNVLKRNGTSVSKYRDGKLVNQHIAQDIIGPEVFFWIRDILLTIFHGLHEVSAYDVVIGLDCLNGFAGIVLKLMGKAKYSIYYTIDLTNARFNNPLLNYLYISLDRFVYKYSDEVWDVSDGIGLVRKKFGYRESVKLHKIVPIGYYPEDFENIEVKQKKFRLIYFGSLYRIMGLQLVIESMPRLVKMFPKVELLIIGGGYYEKELRKLVEDKHMENYVNFEYYADKALMIKRLKTGYVGVAPYLDEEDSYKKYCDPTKVKEYFASGIPVIVTNVPLISREVRKKSLGIAITYNKIEFVSAVKKLFENTRYYNRCTYSIKKYREVFQWEKIFSRALATIPNITHENEG